MWIRAFYARKKKCFKNEHHLANVCNYAKKKNGSIFAEVLCINRKSWTVVKITFSVVARTVLCFFPSIK